jgi:hypothetical protein
MFVAEAGAGAAWNAARRAPACSWASCSAGAGSWARLRGLPVKAVMVDVQVGGHGAVGGGGQQGHGTVHGEDPGCGQGGGQAQGGGSPSAAKVDDGPGCARQALGRRPAIPEDRHETSSHEKVTRE